MPKRAKQQDEDDGRAISLQVRAPDDERNEADNTNLVGDRPQKVTWGKVTDDGKLERQEVTLDADKCTKECCERTPTPEVDDCCAAGTCGDKKTDKGAFLDAAPESSRTFEMRIMHFCCGWLWCCGGNEERDRKKAAPLVTRGGPPKSYLDDDNNPNEQHEWSLDDEDEEAFLDKWRWRAMVLAVITIVWNTFEAFFAIWLGIKSKQLTLITFGGGSTVEVMSAAIVVYRLRREKESGGGKLSVKLLEKCCARLIAIALITIATLAATGATYRLITHGRPETATYGLIMSLTCIVAMYAMYYWKVKAALIINSITLEKEAYCSLGCIRENCVVFLGSILFIFGEKVLKSDALWWVDSVCTYLIVFLVGREGIKSLRFSFSKDFDGTCSCCGGGGETKVKAKSLTINDNPSSQSGGRDSIR